MIAARRNSRLPIEAERCCVCSGAFGRKGVYYRDRQRVCQSCWQWGEMIDAREAVEPPGDSPRALVVALGLCLLSVAFWVGLGWLVLWVIG